MFRHTVLPASGGIVTDCIRYAGCPTAHTPVIAHLRDTRPKKLTLEQISTGILWKFLNIFNFLPSYNFYAHLMQFVTIPPDVGITVCRNMLGN
jgi:hypothetical protein